MARAAFWSFTPQVTVPIFTGGKLEAGLDAAQVRKRIEIARYERTIQVAFREVADALESRAALEAELEAQVARVAAEQRRYDISELRYRTGIDSYLAVLTAQRDLYTAQRALIEVRLARLTNTVALYAALGGGWKE
jgi:multidrug efflux system outer membrane protein